MTGPYARAQQSGCSPSGSTPSSPPNESDGWTLIDAHGDDEGRASAQVPVRRECMRLGQGKISGSGVLKRSGAREKPGVVGARSGSRDRWPPPLRRESEDDDEGNDNDIDSGHEIQGHRGPGQQQKRCFACPMYKYDSVRHRSCSRLQLTRIRDVKQHIFRRHRLPIYCPTCEKTFTVETLRDLHIKERACKEPPGGVSITGITEDQRDSLGRRVNRSLSEVEQWNSIWLILFPNSPRPQSPYVANKIEAALDMILDCWQQEGQGLVRELAGTRDIKGQSDRQLFLASTELIEGLLGRVREKLVDYPAADPPGQETTQPPSPQPAKEVKPKSSASARGSPPMLYDDHMLPPSQMIAPASFLVASSAASFHSDSFIDSSSTPLSLSGDLSGLDSSINAGSPLWWAPPPGDQMAHTGSPWSSRELPEFIDPDLFGFNSPFSITSPFLMEMEP